MGFGGHVQDMNNRLRDNRNAKPSKKAKFQEGNWETRYDKENNSVTKLNFTKLSEEELHYLKIEIRKKIKKEQLLPTIFLGLMAVSILVILFYIFLF